MTFPLSELARLRELLLVDWPEGDSKDRFVAALDEMIGEPEEPEDDGTGTALEPDVR